MWEKLVFVLLLNGTGMEAKSPEANAKVVLAKPMLLRFAEDL
jgi:hypothetical protein